MGTLSIMGTEGDVKVEWNPESADEVEMAEKAFKENTKKGYKAFRMWDDGQQGSEIEKFDKFAEKILFVPAMRGG